MLMKTKLTILSALSLVALIACKREKVVVNPTYNPDDNTVLAKLYLNVSSASGSETKQTADAVQAGGLNFRGMQDVHILTYSVNDVGPKSEPFLYNVTDYKATKDYDLGDMMLPEDASVTTGLRVLQLALPLETNTILLYGRATRTGRDTDDKLGHVDAAGEAVNVTLDNVTFSLKDRMNGRNAEFDLFGDLMGRLLTGIMNTGLEIQTPIRGYKIPEGTNPDDYVDGRYKFWWPDDEYGRGLSMKDESGNYLPDGTHDTNKTEYTFHIGSITWRQLGDEYADPNHGVMAGLSEVMGEAYHNIMTIQSKTVDNQELKELRSASSGSVLRLTEDLFGILTRVVESKPTGYDDKIAQLLAQEIMTRASNFYVANHETGKVSYQTLENIMEGVERLIPERSRAYYVGGTVRIDDSFFYRDNGTSVQVGFPVNLGLPLGSALMTFFNPHKDNVHAPDYNVVQYLSQVPAYGVGGGSFPITNYRYPAELMYYTNSNIRTSSELKKNSDFPTTTAAWPSASSWSGWTGGNKVQSTTQSVGVAKTINYGTALLATRVGYSAPTIFDNNAMLHPGESNNSIEVGTTSNLFEVTGIMIGGVCDQVGWNFLPKTTDFTKMIYDDLSYDGDDNTPGAVSIPKYTAEAADRYTKDIYTLTFDNYDKSKTLDQGQNVVYVALELKNKTGQDLWGELNVIRRDGTFYLVGALDPNSETAIAKFKDGQGNINLSRDDFNYPPFDVSGNTINAPRVFMQDYVTTVTMNFTQESLSHAYVTMPDLRAGQVSLGLSVDVSWKSGYDFTVNLGGGN